jgi:hypothetical protein
MIFKFWSAALLFFGLLISCRQNPGADPGAVRQELRQREIVHLSQGQITERAAEIGDSLCLRAEILFEKNLSMQSDKNSCRPAWDSACLEINRVYQTDIRRLLLSGISPVLKNPKEKQLFEAYQYSRQHKLPLTPNLQKDGEKDFIFTKALTIRNAACASCHKDQTRPELRGNSGDTIAIGMFRFPRKRVVMSFVE